MAKCGGIMATFATASALVLLASAEEKIREDVQSTSSGKDSATYTHVWPTMELGWRVVLGSVMAFCGAAFGSVGGVGGGGIFVPMLTLVIGFDTKSSAAISKCMIVGAAGSTVFFNIRQRHPTLDMPIIDYDLALLFQPMLVLGISIGVTLNVIFANWMVTIILIIFCITTSTIAFIKGIKKWKLETTQKERDRTITQQELSEIDINTSPVESKNKSLPGQPNKQEKVHFMKNVHWKKLGIIICVWIAILALQLIKSYTSSCSTMYWAVNLLQIPVVVAASGYEAIMLYKGKRVIASRGEKGTHFKASQLTFYCVMGVLAGAIGGLVGLGGGVIMGPVFLQMGVPTQVASATATFAMLFSSSMSVVEYYLLKRFPIPYTLYFVGVTTVAALVAQYVVKKVLAILGRASIIIFVLAFVVFSSALLIGGQGIVNMVDKIGHHKYMGLESLCSKHS